MNRSSLTVFISSYVYKSVIKSFPKRFIALLILVGGMTGIGVARDLPPRSEQSFDADWRFLRGDAPGAENPAFDDSAWRTLDVPHDWSIEDLPPRTKGGSAGTVIDDAVAGVAFVGPFSPDSAGGPSTGHMVGGTGWYRKHFTLPAAAAARVVSILFDGIYMDSDVWLNGHHLGNHPYGYTSFAYDLTPFLKPAGEENVLSVRVRNVGKTSRWYSGSGIYRHVTLTETAPLHIAQWGISVTTPQVTKTEATVHIVATVDNAGSNDAPVFIRVELLGPPGRILKADEVSAPMAAAGRQEIPLDLVVKSPPLWSPDTPQVCQAETEIRVAGILVDRTTTSFGIRELKYSAENGFTLNGVPTKLRGACLHHDNGPLGAAAIDRAEARRVELMKAQGFNAIRTSHNPPSPAFLDACDRLGVLVLEEAFDCWATSKNPDDYGKYFNDWWQRDLDAMVLRDRNHPCVILWSIGNELPERADERGYRIEKILSGEVHRLDPTRPVTEAIFEFVDQPGRSWSDTATAFSLLDVGGYNYQARNYERDHQKFPERIMVGTESFPGQIFDYWTIVERNVFAIGDFVWTGMDYLGESGCGRTSIVGDPSTEGNDWPWFNANCGDIDLCGFKKAPSFYRDVVWRRAKLEMAVHRPLPQGRVEHVNLWGWPDELPSWTWPGAENQTMTIAVYSRCDTIRLELNANVVGTQNTGPDTKLTAHFQVPYVPGELRAVGLINGKVIATKILRTVGPAKKIRLVADRTTIQASRNDLAYVTVEITDTDGNLLPDAATLVRFAVNGVGELAAVGSGNPKLPESFHAPCHTTFHGRCLAILRPLGTSGRIQLHATADGLLADELSVRVK